MARKLYDCMKCPGYCCSYPVIEVKDRDAERIAAAPSIMPGPPPAAPSLATATAAIMIS